MSSTSAHMWARWSKMEPVGEDTSFIWSRFQISARCLCSKLRVLATIVRWGLAFEGKRPRLGVQVVGSGSKKMKIFSWDFGGS